MKKGILRLVLFVLLLSIVSSPVTSYAVNPIENESSTYNGLEPMEASVIDAHRSSLLDDMVSTYSIGNPFPDSIDLSTSNAFPPIGDQGIVNSCAAFAAVYYQYTFEVNGEKGISSQTESNQYSPNWPYYALVGDDSNVGLDLSDVYQFLQDHGALKWSDDEYDKDAFDYSMPWPTDNDLVKDAMLTRLYHWNAIEVSSSGTVIESNQDEDLDEIKAALNYGKLLAVGSYWGAYSSNMDDPNREKSIVYRVGILSETSKHALTIVGYDDNVTYDINGDGSIEAGERGAFKVANSHGEDYGDGGFFWIMYDAMNAVSSVSGNWDTSDNRVSAFAVPEIKDVISMEQVLGNNVFTYIYAEDKDPVLIAEINLASHNRTICEIELFNLLPGNRFEEAYATSYKRQEYIVPQNRTLFFDYEELMPSFDDIIGSSTWGVTATLVDVDSYVLSIKLTDNKGNVLKTMIQDSPDTDRFLCNINFQYGDMNYDGILTTTDATLIMQTVSGYSTISNLQKNLADYNRDGKVTTADMSALMQAIG